MSGYRVIIAVVGLLLFSTKAWLAAQEIAGIDRFRVDNVVQVERDDQVIETKTLTIFSEGQVFDFIGDYGEVIIYRRQTGQFTIIDPIRRIQTELKLDELNRAIALIRAMLSEKKDDKFCQFMANPVFDVSRSDGNEVLFQSKWIDYKVNTIPFERESMAAEYYHFVEVYSKLNIYLNPGSVTPFARLKVNEILQQTGHFPTEFNLTVYPKGKWIFGKTIKIQSKHKVIRRLSEQDQARIMRALHFAEQFPLIPFSEYQRKIKEQP